MRKYDWDVIDRGQIKVATKKHIEESRRLLIELEGILPSRPGMSEYQVGKVAKMRPCHKCGCEHGMVAQQLSPRSGRAIKRFMVVCERCWNVDVRSNSVEGAVLEQNNMNWALKRE